MLETVGRIGQKLATFLRHFGIDVVGSQALEVKVSLRSRIPPLQDPRLVLVSQQANRGRRQQEASTTLGT